MKKIVVGIVFIIMLAAVGLWWFQARSISVFFAKDAVRVLAYAASDMFHRDPSTTPDEIDRMIKSQHEASNINLKMDPNGKAVDPFGTAFRVEHQVHSGTSITTVTSAGPDREFGTNDDIRFKHKKDPEPQPSR